MWNQVVIIVGAVQWDVATIDRQTGRVQLARWSEFQLDVDKPLSPVLSIFKVCLAYI